MEKQNKPYVRCPYYEIARGQREMELSRGLTEKGTQGYADRGCFNNCSGYNIECEIYKSILEEDDFS